MKISYGKNVYGSDEIKAVVNQLNTTTQMGKSVNNFEKKISKYFLKKYGLMLILLFGFISNKSFKFKRR